ncbi:hypothetical protein T06_16281 [Trichinella sp. T6]|nr:hypothetical protein T06_16281 [Trichinella sp. T6]
MLAALYRIEHKSRKWTRRIFFWIISTAMTNAWQLYKKDRKEMPGTCTDTMDLLSFTCQPSDVSREVAKDQTSHWPEITQTKKDEDADCVVN